MATIKAIEGRSVHQIQSGQVIVDLCSVVKELVENSLDAGATSIDVRFKSNGLDSIEVQDNGQGIAPDDYETIALKHYTSKLSTYDDLASLDTFGFRGEALSSLCALSHFHIVTARARDGAKGMRLDFEISGKLKGTSVAASQKGTTVAVENLFYNLPVRRRELEKNIKREYGKVLGLLHAYACISVGVRFAVSNQAAKGKKSSIFSTKANPTTRENIVNVYGAKTLLALIPLDLTLEMQPSSLPSQAAKNWGAQDDTTGSSREVRIQGHISRPVVGEGRQTPDRQMFFVNSRPCALPQVSKAVNEVYKSYNVTQSPFVFANLVMDTGSYDVNVSPDKRMILLHDQTALLEALKEALIKLFEEHDQSVPQAQLGARKLPHHKPLNVMRPFLTAREVADAENVARQAVGGGDEDGVEDGTNPQQKGTSVSLIQKFIGRDATSRSQLPAAAPARQKSDEISKNKQKLMRSLQKNKEPEGSTPHEVPNEQAMDVDSSPPQSPAIPRPVQDFNDRIANLQAKSKSPQPGTEPPGPSADEEQGIAAVRSSSQKSSPGPIQNAFDRMRPKRAPAETATITIGNTTTTTTIGTTPQAKRRRIHAPKYDLAGGLLPSPGKKMGFASSLRVFAAPGTQADEGAEDEEDEIEDEEGDQAGDGEEMSVDGGGDVDEAASSVPDEVSEAPKDNEADAPDGEVSEKEGGQSVADSDASDKDDEEVEQDGEAGDARVPLREESPLFVQQGEDSDEEYLDEEEKKAREEARVADIIAKAEETAARPTQDNLKRAANIFKGSVRKNSTLQFVQTLDTSVARIAHTLSRQTQRLQACAEDGGGSNAAGIQTEQTPEERLSLTVSKSDFGRMRIVGQFNLGFILAVRPASAKDSTTATTPKTSTVSHVDELFIIDQHASDEKINFERLTSTTILAPQRLVRPLPLDLTAIEEETILAHPAAFAANGFLLTTDTSGESPVGRRCRLLGLPVSKETTFTASDLEELVALLNETSLSSEKESSIPRPGKVRRMLAMRACRSSIMIGKTLTKRQMKAVVDKMGEIDKPWNCPHGRPTMRHLASLGEWEGWREGDGVVGLLDGDGEEGETGTGTGTDWRGFLKGERGGSG